MPRREGTEFVNYITYSVIYYLPQLKPQKFVMVNLININSNCLKYNKSSINDLNTKMTEYNEYLGPGLGQAENSVKPINMIISFPWHLDLQPPNRIKNIKQKYCRCIR